MSSITRIFKQTFFNTSLSLRNQIHSSPVFCGAKWRIKQGFAQNRSSSGPLTELPDYTFLDGRPTPMGGNQMTRLKTQKEYAEKIVQLISEVDFAVQRHKDMQEEKGNVRNKILAGRLKEKGVSLLKNKK